MSIQSEIDRINSNVQSALNAVADTGVSVPEGANSDNLPAAVSALANEKQDKLTGAQGQIVGFGPDGKAVAQDKPTYAASEVGADASGAAAAVQSNLDGHTGNTTVHITAAERTSWNDKSGKAVSFTVTLTAVGWSDNTQTVSNSNFVTSGYAYTVCPAGDSFAGYAESVIYADDVNTAGKITFHCNEAPTANLTVNILRTEATA